MDIKIIAEYPTEQDRFSTVNEEVDGYLSRRYNRDSIGGLQEQINSLISLNVKLVSHLVERRLITLDELQEMLNMRDKIEERKD